MMIGKNHSGKTDEAIFRKHMMNHAILFWDPKQVAKHMKLHQVCGEKWIKMGVAHPITEHPFKNQSHAMRI